MSKSRFFLKIFGLTFLIAGAGLLFFVSGPVKEKVTSFVGSSAGQVKGASTERAKKITGSIFSDITDGVAVAQKQVLNMKVGDVLNSLSRVQKIPQDLNALFKYVSDQVANVLESKK